MLKYTKRKIQLEDMSFCWLEYIKNTTESMSSTLRITHIPNKVLENKSKTTN